MILAARFAGSYISCSCRAGVAENSSRQKRLCLFETVTVAEACNGSVTPGAWLTPSLLPPCGAGLHAAAGTRPPPHPLSLQHHREEGSERCW